MFDGIEPVSLAVILVATLTLFGVGRLPALFEQFGRGIGRGGPPDGFA